MAWNDGNARVSAAVSVVALLLATGRTSAEIRTVLNLRYPANGVTHVTVDWGEVYGNPVAFAGDVDGDGFDDFLIRDPDPNHGYSPGTILVYGQAQTPATAPLSQLRQTYFRHGDPTTGVYPECDWYPYGSAGDVDGDAYADFLFGSCSTDWQGIEDTGMVLVIFGASNYPPKVNLADLPGSGVRSLRFISKESQLFAGWAVASVGDINGDGKPDFAISTIEAPGTEDSQRGGGRVYVVYGGFNATHDILLSDVGASVPGFTLNGAFGSQGSLGDSLGDWLGFSLAKVGDVNADGYNDFIVGAGGSKTNQGSAYVVYGGRNISSSINVSELGTWGVEIHGPQGGGNFGHSLSGVGDVDADGLSDFVVGSPNIDFLGIGFAGRAYLLYGDSTWDQEVFVDNPNLRKFELRGTPPVSFHYPYGELGWVVAGIGDWNQDGIPDFLVSAEREAEGFDERTGHVYVIYGGPNLPDQAFDSDVGTEALPGIALIGSNSLVGLGSQVAAGGDFNGDMTLDFIVTAPFFSPHLPSEDSSIYVVLGGIAGTEDTLEIAAVEPPFGSFEGGYDVRIFGNGFIGNEVIRFGEAGALETRVVTSGEIVVKVPSRGGPGKVDVEVHRGPKTARINAGFEYTLPRAHPDIILDDKTLEHGPFRTLVIRDFGSSTAPRAVRQFLNVSFGDLNGDGIEDLIVGSPQAEGEFPQGTVSIVFGAKDLPATIEAGEIGEFGSLIVGEESLFAFGFYHAVLGDVNGDGFDDLAVTGALDQPNPNPLSPSGRSYVIFGRKNWSQKLSMEQEIAEGRALFWANPACGSVTAGGPGDLNRDGQPDLILGNGICTGEMGSIRLFSGTALQPNSVNPVSPFSVITGDPTPVVPPITGAVTPRLFGSALCGAKDLNGDGFADFLVGANHLLGEVFFVLGGADGFPQQASINDLLVSGRAVRVRKEVMLGQLGTSVGGAGDFNGDLLADAIVGVPGGGRDFHGETYIVFGSPTLGGSTRDIDLLQTGPSKLRLDGEFPYDWSGLSVAGLGDFNGDGLSDIGIVGSDLRNHIGRAYVVFGTKNPPQELRLDQLSDHGFRIIGASVENWFSAGSPGGIAGGDLNGDGLTDLAIGEMTPEGKRVVVIFGQKQRDGTFVRGEVNDDGQVDLSDAVSILKYLFVGGKEPVCLEAADVNDSGSLDLSDGVYLLNHLFLGGEPPPAPYPTAGKDPTPDALGCFGQ